MKGVVSGRKEVCYGTKALNTYTNTGKHHSILYTELVKIKM